MTSPVFEGRVLGISRDASVPTNVMMTLTGNNIKLANDEVHRWLKVSLTSSSATPHKRNFKNPDVLKHGLSIRNSVLQDCIGIISGYLQQERRMDTASRFPEWDLLIRQPLIWVGEKDVALVFDANMDQSEEMGARVALLKGLYSKYSSKEFAARKIMDCSNLDFDKDSSILFPNEQSDNHNLIEEALRALHVKDVNNDLSVAHALTKATGVIVATDDIVFPAQLTLKSRLVSGLKRYWVEAASKS